MQRHRVGLPACYFDSPIGRNLQAHQRPPMYGMTGWTPEQDSALLRKITRARKYDPLKLHGMKLHGMQPGDPVE